MLTRSPPPHQRVTLQTFKFVALSNCTNIAYLAARCLHFGANLFAKKKRNKRKLQIDARVKSQTNVDGVNSFRLYVYACVCVCARARLKFCANCAISIFVSFQVEEFRFFLSKKLFAVIWRRQKLNSNRLSVHAPKCMQSYIWKLHLFAFKIINFCKQSLLHTHPCGTSALITFANTYYL